MGGEVMIDVDARDVIDRGRPRQDYEAHERVPGLIEYTDWYRYDGMDVLLSVEFAKEDWESKELEDLPWGTAPAAVLAVIREEAERWAKHGATDGTRSAGSSAGWPEAWCCTARSTTPRATPCARSRTGGTGPWACGSGTRRASRRARCTTAEGCRGR